MLGAKSRLRIHAYIGILSVLLLTAKALLSVASELGFGEALPLSIGRLGAIFGVLAFLSGGGLGKFLSDQRSRTAELHMILMLAGLTLQVPSLAEELPHPLAVFASWIGLASMGIGWIYGRKIFDRTKIRFPWESGEQ
ncbi:hypothetical protein [Leptospira fletcheri]|uniref:hypothetical protein n=1 Tax=Leptospira fletcheri TaxID=2484981 RepID=UPI001FE6A81B|nr:hypothetical protein [Leptospira fletcheri]